MSAMLKGMSSVSSLVVLVSALITTLVWNADLVLLWKMVLTLWLCAYAVLLGCFEAEMDRLKTQEKSH